MIMEKITFEPVKIEIVEFDSEDVITTSSGQFPTPEY